MTPLNSILYNSQASNLAIHGKHPFYQHALINLPQLLGPAFLLIFFIRRITLPMIASISGVFILSLVPHQEARFLIPAVSLILSSLKLPRSFSRSFISSWLVCNALLGLLMGTYHQGGVVPAQTWLGNDLNYDVLGSKVFWWKTYSPPTWLLDGRLRETEIVDLMGLPANDLQNRICFSESQEAASQTRLLVAPRSATFLDRFIGHRYGESMHLTEAWSVKSHVNLDDLDFGDDGIIPTLRRVVGRRGLVIWNVKCHLN